MTQRSFNIPLAGIAEPNITPTPSPSPLPTRLPNPPKEIKAVYLTSWSAGTPSKINEVIQLAKTTEINAVVIDIKDYTGKVVFATDNPLINKMGSVEVRIQGFPALINRLHKENIYVIVRIVVFQDLHLAKVRPDLAVRDAAGKIWRDRKGLTWVDPASKDVWDYHVAIAKTAASFGVDELNFDYIRFPSDGNLAAIRYPVWKSKEASEHQVIRQFFSYLRQNLEFTGTPLSADLFGLSTVNSDDLGIGQVLEDAFPYFDYISPMVYPSHYASGFIGYKNPAAYPYEVIRYSLDKAVMRRNALLAATSTDDTVVSEPEHQALVLGEIRPWLQAFNLGADYTPHMIRKEIQAVYDAGLTAGWYLWNPSNVYNAAALLPE